MKKILFSSLVLVLLLGMAVPVLAQTESTFNGTVVSIDAGAGTFQLKVSETETYTVAAPAGFDLTRLSVDSTVRVIGVLAGTTITASQILLPTEYVGTVLSIDLAAGTFTFQAKTGETFIVTPSENYDLTLLAVGDVIVLTGLQGADTFVATGIQILFDMDAEGNKGGNYCENLSEIHPVAQRLAEESGLYYEQIMSWFCVDGFGLGEIKSAIQANEKLLGTASVAEILAMKKELGGWGKVKQTLELVGNAKHTQSDEPLTIQSEIQNGNADHDKNPETPPQAKNDKNKNK